MEIDRRTFLHATLAAAGALALPSCARSDSPPPSTSPAPPGPAPRLTLRLPGGGSQRGFPSPLAYSPGGYGLMAYIYDTLLWSDATGTLLPWLAASFQRSADGLTYTFDLRDNARWHDGRPVTPDDVVFTFAYFRANRAKLPPFLLYEPEHVKSVTPSGPRRVQIQLDQPVVTFPRKVAGHFPIVPRHIWSGVGDPARVQDPRMLVGSGPYRLESFDPAQGGYLYNANDDFYLGRPFVKRLEIRAVDDELSALRAGEVDAGGPPTSGAPVRPEVLRPFRRDRAYGVLDAPLEFPTALYWNLAKGGALADVRFRRACARAIDRADLVERVLGGSGEPGNPGFLPPGHPFHVDVEQYPFDVGAANRLLDDAGYRRGQGGIRQGPDGRPLRFRLLAVAEAAPAVELVVGSLRRIGVQLDIDPVDFLKVLSGADYEMAVFFYGGVSDDPDYMREVYSSRVPKKFQAAKGYQDAQLDDVADRQLVTLDEGERRRLVASMQQTVARDLPLLHLFYTRSFHVFRKSVFDQWAYKAQGDGPYSKQTFVTGQVGGLTMRPVREGS